jgi:hypothetical protein
MSINNPFLKVSLVEFGSDLRGLDNKIGLAVAEQADGVTGPGRTWIVRPVGRRYPGGDSAQRLTSGSLT